MIWRRKKPKLDAEGNDTRWDQTITIRVIQVPREEMGQYASRRHRRGSAMAVYKKVGGEHRLYVPRLSEEFGDFEQQRMLGQEIRKLLTREQRKRLRKEMQLRDQAVGHETKHALGYSH